MIRGSWYSLPIPAQTLQALVVQRIIFLVNINIMKIGNAVTYKINGATHEDIDQFRNQKNKLIGSYRGFILELGKKCLVPALRKEQAKKKRACEYASAFNSKSLCTPTCAAGLSADMDLETRRTRSSARREVFSGGEVNPNIRVKGSTPPSTKNGTVDGHIRGQLCETPFFIILCNKDGKFMGGKQCGLCKRQTRFYCMGCHQYFCSPPPSQKKDDITDDLKTDAEIIEVNLGEKQKWIATGKTPSGKVVRRIYRQFSDNESHLHDTGTQAQVEKDINVTAQT